MSKGFVHSTESFGAVDGPGIRFVIFLSGCRMRCQYCHNPDTWEMQTGTLWSSEDLLSKALRYRTYWGENGGITVSGGEPLLQLDFVLSLFQKAKEQGVHTALDTSGNPFKRETPFLEQFQKLMEVTDLVLLDIKEMNEARHKKLTGYTNRNILDMALYLSDIGKPMWIRHVLVPGRTDFDEDLDELHKFLSELKTVERIEVLPYHTLGVFKYRELGLDYPLEGIDPPGKDRIRNAEKRLCPGNFDG